MTHVSDKTSELTTDNTFVGAAQMNMTADATAEEAPGKEEGPAEETPKDEGKGESVTPEILSDDPWKDK